MWLAYRDAESADTGVRKGGLWARRRTQLVRRSSPSRPSRVPHNGRGKPAQARPGDSGLSLRIGLGKVWTCRVLLSGRGGGRGALATSPAQPVFWAASTGGSPPFSRQAT